jgi:cysteine desulfurase/selenocysteine lyase
MLTPDSRLREFPILADQAYLNTAAEGIPPPAVNRAVEAYLRDKLDGMNGRPAHFARLAACRDVAARMIGMQPEEVAFCSCSSEAYNLLATALDLGSGDEVVVSDLDFPAGVTPWLVPSARCTPRLWRAVAGRLDVADLERILSPRTRLVQVSLVSFWNGHHLDWDAVHEAVRRLAPDCLLAVDVTQALGRVPRLCPGADLVISSTHKWVLGLHGGCIVGVRGEAADRLTPRAGGWFHIENAFDADRFERVVGRRGAAGYAVGMPNFAAIYALEAALSFIESTGVEAIAAHADPLVARAAAGLAAAGIDLLCPAEAARPGGILAFRHADSQRLHELLERESVRVMHHAGRIRIAIHGYNTADDVDRLIDAILRWRGPLPRSTAG